MDEIDASAIGYNQSRRSNYTLLPSLGYSFFGKDDTVDLFWPPRTKKCTKQAAGKCNREKAPPRMSLAAHMRPVERLTGLYAVTAKSGLYEKPSGNAISQAVFSLFSQTPARRVSLCAAPANIMWI
jgi:hypothetical protein